MISKPKTSLGQLITAVVYLAIFPIVFLLVAGDWRWLEGWIFSAIFFCGSVATLVYLYVNDPALLNERYAAPVQEGQKSWDKVLTVFFFLSFLSWYVIMPLDARRFRWSPEFPVWLKVLGVTLLVAGFALMFGALKENSYAAPVVKMQKERGQRVISTGLYGIVRHPMYSGATALFFGAALLVGSVYASWMAVLLTLTLAVRSVGEERMLKQELAGYSDYMARVRRRMIPFVF